MADLKVVTVSRLAQWRTDVVDFQAVKSYPFKMGIWNWSLHVDSVGNRLTVRLSPESSNIYSEQPPFARLVLRIYIPGPGRKVATSEVYEIKFWKTGHLYWTVDGIFRGRCVIEVEFLDLKDKEATPIWVGHASEAMQSLMIQSTHHCLSQMLKEEIHFDVTINTFDGSLNAHKAVLCASSPVFRSMFHHNLKEKESSTIYIEDMSLESWTTFLNYLYGTMKKGDLWKHRFVLLEAANKYGITYLKDACEDWLLEDISLDNVLERLQKAWLYPLHKLKNACLKFLFEFGKAYDIREEINNFFMHADRELTRDMFQEMLTTFWKPVLDDPTDDPTAKRARTS